MGKQRRTRKKLHTVAPSTSTNISTPKENDSDLKMDALPLPLINDNIFEGININYKCLSNKLSSDDVTSLKSFRSIKSDLGANRILPKKDKLRLRREMLQQKMDILNQSKRAEELKKRRKRVALVGDLNPLHDALPDLQSLLKKESSATSSNSSATSSSKIRGIQKQSKRKKELVQGVRLYKQLLKNKSFQNNPAQVISNHVKNIVELQKRT